MINKMNNINKILVVFIISLINVGTMIGAEKVSNDIDEIFADSKFRKQFKELLSCNNIKAVKGINKDDVAFKFTPGARGENSYLKIYNISSKYDFSKGFTFGAWIQVAPSYDNKTGKTMDIAGNFVTDRGKGFRIVLLRGCLSFRSGSGKPYETAKRWGIATKKIIQPGIWYHILTSYDGDRFRIYINGKRVRSSLPDIKLTKGKLAICIGSYHDGKVYGFNGKMQHIIIYDKALPEKEIKKLAGAK